jgi:hypothetical protein
VGCYGGIVRVVYGDSTAIATLAAHTEDRENP